ncbi:DUF6545 domain-containing protein [Streptomyces sp. HD1123-B1]|uniref:DUF6545 domain-containing protein n=1 Tax=Streptomyces huangiella TaxID=3228804 RepID=UPI003D7EC389
MEAPFGDLGNLSHRVEALVPCLGGLGAVPCIGYLTGADSPWWCRLGVTCPVVTAFALPTAATGDCADPPCACGDDDGQSAKSLGGPVHGSPRADGDAWCVAMKAGMPHRSCDVSASNEVRRCGSSRLGPASGRSTMGPLLQSSAGQFPVGDRMRGPPTAVPPPTRLIDLLPRRRLSYRLYRRVIEIRDGHLSLRS